MAFLGKTQKSTSFAAAPRKAHVALKLRDLLIVLLIFSGVLFVSPYYLSNTRAATIGVPGGTYLQSVVYDPLNQNILTVSRGPNQFTGSSPNALYVISGVTQSLLSTRNFASFHPDCIAYDPAIQEVFIVGNDDNTGNTEVMILDGHTLGAITTLFFPRANQNSLAYDPADLKMFLAVAGVGVWVINNKNVPTKVLNAGGMSLAYDSANQEMYMANESFVSSQLLQVIDSSTYSVVASLSLFGAGLGYNPSNQEMYLSDQSGHEVFAINAVTNTLVTTISTSVNLSCYTTTDEGMVYNPLTQEMYALAVFGIPSAFNSASCPSFIDIISKTNTVVGNISNDGAGEEQITGGWASMAVFDPANNDIYFVQTFTGLFYFLDSIYRVHQINLLCAFSCQNHGLLPEGVYDQAHHQLYFPQPYDNTVAVINTISSKQVTNIKGFSSPAGAAFDSKNLDLYVSNSNGMVSVVKTGTNKIIANIGVGTSPGAELFDARNGDVYVANYGSNTISVISGGTNKVIKTIAVGAGPDGIALDSRNHNLYVSNKLSDTVSVINGQTNSLMTTADVGGGPQGIAFDSANHDVYVARSDGSISIINDQTNLVILTIPVGTNLYGVVFDPSDGDVFITDSAGGTISVLDNSNNNVIATLFTGFTPAGLPYSPFGIVYDQDNKFVYVGVSIVGGTSASIWKIGS